MFSENDSDSSMTEMASTSESKNVITVYGRVIHLSDDKVAVTRSKYLTIKLVVQSGFDIN